jgi:ribonuclease HI
MLRSGKIYSDGGSRGNPGPAAGAYLILDENGKNLKQDSQFLGIRTNNQAEYEALIFALRAASGLGLQDIVSHLDSELVCKHLTGEYKVKNPDLRLLWEEAQNLKRCFGTIVFVNVPRTNLFIQEADRLVNECLDKKFGKLAKS